MPNLTAAQASQNALNIAVPLAKGLQVGVYEDVYDIVQDLCAAVILLAEVINVNAAALPTGIVPSTVFLGTQYSATQPNTSPAQTIQR